MIEIDIQSKNHLRILFSMESIIVESNYII